MACFINCIISRPCAEAHGYTAQTPQNTRFAGFRKITPTLSPAKRYFAASALRSRVLQHMVNSLEIPRTMRRQTLAASILLAAASGLSAAHSLALPPTVQTQHNERGPDGRKFSGNAADYGECQS